MDKERKHKNIFETAAEKLAGKDQKEPAAPQQQQNTSSSDNVDLTNFKKFSGKRFKDPEINEMMRKIEEMKHDLNQRMEYISRISGIKWKDIIVMMQDPKSFSKEEWERIQKFKGEFGEKVWNAIGRDLNPPPEHVRENIKGERRAKTLGSRKKWIPMK